MTDVVEKVGFETGGVRALSIWQILGLSGLLALPMRAMAQRQQLTQRNSRAGELWRRPSETQGQRFEILHDGGKVELVART